MSATNATTNYSLPLFVGTDKPAWLVDWNGAMNAIDSAIAQNASDIASEATTVSGLSTTVASHTSSISTITGQISTITTNVNSNTGAINTINSLIGNGLPTTTDQTIIGAINELHANQGDLANLTTTAKTDLVSAVNEVNSNKASAKTLRATSTTGDRATQLSQLYSAFMALTEDEKREAYIFTGNTYYKLATVTETNAKFYIVLMEDSLTGITIITLTIGNSVANSHWVSASMTSGAYPTIAVADSTALPDGTLKLYA